MKRSMLGRRGAAAVELAVTMVLLVPLILYTIFLEDLLSYRLENQEPTMTAGWDYITNDYMRADLRDIQKLNRYKFCDHTAAFDSFDVGYDCQGAELGGGAGATGGTRGSHHQAGGAHQCWIVSGAEQVTCGVDKTGGAIATLVGTPATLFTGSPWNQGGVVTCTARLGVMNYMLPQKFMEWAGRNDVTSKGRNNAGAGANATFTDIDAATTDNSVHGEAGASANAWILRTESFAVMADPWALNDIDDVDPMSWSPATSLARPFSYPGYIVGIDTPYNELLSRSGWYYNQYGKDALKSAQSYFDDSDISGSDGFLNKSILLGADRDGVGVGGIGTGGDDPGSLPVEWSKNKQRPGGDEGYASGWADDRQSGVSSSREQMWNSKKYPWEYPAN